MDFQHQKHLLLALTDHVAGATVCLDLSGATGITLHLTQSFKHIIPTITRGLE